MKVKFSLKLVNTADDSEYSSIKSDASKKPRRCYGLLAPILVKGSIEIYDKTADTPFGQKNKKGQILDDAKFMEPVWRHVSAVTQDTVVTEIKPAPVESQPLNPKNIKVDIRYPQPSEPPLQTKAPILAVSDPLSELQPTTARTNAPLLDAEDPDTRKFASNKNPTQISIPAFMNADRAAKMRQLVQEARMKRPLLVSGFPNFR